MRRHSSVGSRELEGQVLGVLDLKLSYSAVVDKRGRLVIRKEVRDAMGLPNGGFVEWIVEDDQARLRPALTDSKDG
jgi:hypothetical protein